MTTRSERPGGPGAGGPAPGERSGQPQRAERATPASGAGNPASDAGGEHANRRQVLYWRLLARVFGAEEQPALESASVAIVDDLGLPAALLDPSVSVDTVVQRFPALAG